MKWRVAEAKVRFSELLRAASEEPQLIYNRDRPVAAVVDAETFQAFEAWRKNDGQKTVGHAFEELRSILREESGTFEIPPRRDRHNAFIDAIDDSTPV